MFRNIIDIIKKNILTTEKVLKSSDILKTIEGILDEIIFALKNNKRFSYVVTVAVLQMPSI